LIFIHNLKAKEENNPELLNEMKEQIKGLQGKIYTGSMEEDDFEGNCIQLFRITRFHQQLVLRKINMID
jgi:hypothetical protein